MFRAYDKPTREAHRLCMRAKALIFRAQDSFANAADPREAVERDNLRPGAARDIAKFRKAFGKHLERIRAELERLDNLAILALADDNEQCKCGAYHSGEGRDHACGCPQASDDFWTGGDLLRPWDLPTDETQRR